MRSEIARLESLTRSEINSGWRSIVVGQAADSGDGGGG